MTRPDAPTLRPSLPLGDVLITAAAWAAATAGLALGAGPLWLALVVLAVPMAAFVAAGHLAGRGAIMACLATALGVGLAGPDLLVAAVLIGLVDAAALAGGLAADRMAPATTTAAAPVVQGRWMSVVVVGEAEAARRPAPEPVRIARAGRAGRRSVA